MCNKIAQFDSTQSAYYGLSRSLFPAGGTNNPIVMDCFIKTQSTYAPLPFTAASMTSTIAGHSTLFLASAYNDTATTYYRSYEVGIVDWLANGANSAYPSTAAKTFYNLLDGVADPDVTRNANSVTYAGMKLSLLGSNIHLTDWFRSLR